MSEYFSFDVRLRGIDPPIWRRFLVRGSTTFQTFHEAIQDACGWENRHFGSFRDVESGRPIVNLPDEEFGHPDPQAKRAKLANYFSEDGPQECMYEYDSGDSWIHDITLIETVELDEEFQRRLLDGARDFPKEDCGGVAGYERCMMVLQTGEDPWEEDPKELLAWIGDWRPDSFDLERLKSRFDL